MIYCVYNKATGIIRSRFDTQESDATRQVLDGEDIYYGDADARRHRIDVKTGRLIDMLDHRPSDDAIWIKSEGRWMPQEEFARVEMVIVRAKLDALEKKQLRIDRELRLRPSEVGADGKTPSQRLEELDLEIEKLRDQITSGTGRTEP